MPRKYITERVCRGCGTTFQPNTAYHIKYCSNACRSIDNRRNSPHYNNNGSPDGNGYLQIYTPDGRRMRQHRYVMEQHLGRPLTEDEVVHHLDGDVKNNDISNLQILTRLEHALLHNVGRVSPNKLKPGQWSKKFNACVSCNTTNDNHVGNGLCKSCYQHKRVQAKINLATEPDWNHSRQGTLFETSLTEIQ